LLSATATGKGLVIVRPKSEHGLVFTQPTGHPVDPSRDYQDWQQLLVSVGVRKARLHDARHTAASLLLAQGVPARVVMEMLATLRSP
jgi:integrase